jgi:serine/threonine protein kinase
MLQNRYLIERLLGGGGMGMVYLAQDQRLANRFCAIKEMVDHFIDPQQRLEANEYFAREADTLAQLKHPAIPAISDRFDDRNRHYLVMEYVEGRNLEEEIAVLGHPLSEGLVIDIGRQLCDVLAYLHGFSPPMVYRDMKPSNVMLTSRGKVMLVDFGIARLFKAAGKGTMIGTLGFAPPEQYQGLVDPRSDIYSLGATLHYVLTGRDPEKFPPFSFPPVRELQPEVSANLAGAIDRALAYKMEDRPQTIQAFRDMMLYGSGLTTTGVVGVSPKGRTADLTPLPEFTPVPVERSRFRRAFGLVAFSAVLGTAAFAATYVYSSPQLQMRLGIKPLIDSLPWKHEELLAKAREHPLEFGRMTLRLSTRDGSPVSPPKTSFTDAELADARYLSWDADFSNKLAGLEGRTQKIEAHFYDPNGLQIASSSADRFVAPAQTQVNFKGVALIPTLGDQPLGNYKARLYLGDQVLGEQQFSVTQDLAAKARLESEKATAATAAKAEETGRKEEQQRIAMLEDRRRKPLELQGVRFYNSTRTGTPLAPASDTFDASKVLFVNWEVTFKNRLYGLEPNQYRVDAAYVAPDGRTLGSVDDVKSAPPNARSVTFSGRVGNSAGGAFLPGTYSVNFYLNGQYFAQRRFHVVSSGGFGKYGTPGGTGGGGGGTSGSGTSSFDTPTLANGTINGLAGKASVGMEMRLRPQPNGFLHGELLIHEPGYGLTPIDGFIRGDHLEFQVPYGSSTLYFEGQRRNQNLSGRFQAEPSGSKGSWTARID